MEKEDSLLKNPNEIGILTIKFDMYDDFTISDCGQNFFEDEIEEFDLVNQFNTLAEKIDFLMNRIQTNNINNEEKEKLILMLRSKKIAIIDYSMRFKEEKEKYISDYNYYSDVLKEYKKKFRKIKSKKDKKLILASSHNIQNVLFQNLKDLTKDYSTLLETFCEEEETIKNFFNEYNYKY